MELLQIKHNDYLKVDDVTTEQVMDFTTITSMQTQKV